MKERRRNPVFLPLILSVPASVTAAAARGCPLPFPLPSLPFSVGGSAARRHGSGELERLIDSIMPRSSARLRDRRRRATGATARGFPPPLGPPESLVFRRVILRFYNSRAKNSACWACCVFSRRAHQLGAGQEYRYAAAPMCSIRTFINGTLVVAPPTHPDSALLPGLLHVGKLLTCTGAAAGVAGLKE